MGHIPRTRVQWTLGYPNTLGPGPVQISEKFGYVKVTVAELYS